MAATNLMYLDHNATTPLLPEVAAAMRPFESDCFANPASSHLAGQKARQSLDRARQTVADCLDCDFDEVLFTSGATESNNLAIASLAGDRSSVIVTSKLEHPSVAEPVNELAKRGFEIRDVPIGGEGQLEVEAVRGLSQGEAR